MNIAYCLRFDEFDSLIPSKTHAYYYSIAYRL